MFHFQQIRVVQLPLGERCCRVMSFNKRDSNSIVTNYYQSGLYTMKESVMIELLMMIIDEPLFDVLRTKEQLGYHVFATLRDTFGILGYSISVNAHANKSTTSHVDERIEAFIRHAHEILNRMSAKKLSGIKNDLIKLKQCGDVLLAEEVTRNWEEIVSEQYLFDRCFREVETIEGVKIQEIRKWWKESNHCDQSSLCRKLSVQVGFIIFLSLDVTDISPKQHIIS